MADYPLPKFHFEVTVDGVDLKGGFTEVSGLDVETEPLEYRSGDMKQFSKIKMAGMQKYSNITMKRGTFRERKGFAEWWNSAVKQADKTQYQHLVTITLKDESGNDAVVWKATNAFPLKVQSTDLKADGNEIAIESIELAHEGLTIEFK